MSANSAGSNPFATNNSGGGVGTLTAQPDMSSYQTLQPGQNTPYTPPSWLTGDMANSMQPIQNYPVTNYGRWNWSNNPATTNGYGIATNNGWPALQFPGGNNSGQPTAGAAPGGAKVGTPVADGGSFGPPAPPTVQPPSGFAGAPAVDPTTGLTPQGLTSSGWSAQQAANRAAVQQGRMNDPNLMGQPKAGLSGNGMNMASFQGMTPQQQYAYLNSGRTVPGLSPNYINSLMQQPQGGSLLGQ